MERKKGFGGAFQIPGVPQVPTSYNYVERYLEIDNGIIRRPGLGSRSPPV